jgi:hypothetical protein
MPLPEKVSTILYKIGQVAAEVPCHFEGFREYVSVFVSQKSAIMGADRRFAYFKESDTLFRACRFRVRSELIEADADVGPEDLLDLQEIYLPSEDAVQFVVSMWLPDLAELGRPADCSIPM